MKKINKKWIPLFLTMLMLISTFSGTALANAESAADNTFQNQEQTIETPQENSSSETAQKPAEEPAEQAQASTEEKVEAAKEPSPADEETAAGRPAVLRGSANDNAGEVPEDAVASVGDGDSPNYYNTLQDAINAAKSGDTIYLLKDVAENITSTEDKTYTLDMQGHEIAPNGGRVYYVYGGEVTLKNGTLTGGDSEYGGILIYNATFEGDSITVTGNTSTDGYGAVFIWDSKASLTNCTISNNKSARLGAGIALYGNSSLVGSGITVSENKFYEGNYAESEWLGAGIYSGADSTIELKDNSVIENNDGYRGAGVYTSGSLIITNSNISNNTASSWGGGIYTTNTLTIDNSTISENTASAQGSGIAIYGATFNGTKVTITENKTTKGYGAVYGSSSTLSLTNSVVSNNVAGYLGAGIALYNSSLTGSGLTANGNSFNDTRNSTYWLGGGIYSHDATSTIELKDSSVIENNSGYQGGGIYALGTLTITDSTVSGNRTTSIGGGIYAQGTLSVTGTNIKGNKGGGGGGIYARDALTIRSSKITNNTSESYGGGIYAYGDGAFNMVDCEVSNNTARDGGGLHLNGQINIEDTTITGNESSNSAAALYLVGVDNRYLSNVTVSNNVCSNTYTGGNSSVAYMQLASQATGDYSLQLENCTFEGNSAVNTIYMSSSGTPAIFRGCTIQDNTSGKATIYFDSASPTSGLIMENCEIVNNKAGVTGAIMDVSGGTTTLTNITATGNIATGESDPKTGGIYIDKDNGRGEVTVTACNVEQNTLLDNSINNWYISSVSKVTFDADRQVAKIGDKTYTSIADAVADAKDGNTIVLIAGEEDEYGKAFSSTNVDTTNTKEITIDLNGCTINSVDENLFTVGSGSKLILENAGVINGRISVADGGSLTLNCQADKVAVTLADRGTLAAGDDFACDSLKLYLSEEALSSFNAGQTEQDDIVLIKDADEDLIEKIIIAGLTNPLVSIKAQNGNLILHKDVLNGIFIDGGSGNDGNNGSYENPVKTFEAAKTLLNSDNNGLDKIYVIGEVTVNNDETWDLDGKTIARYPTYKGNMISVTNGKLTLQEIVIDGSREHGVKDAQSMIYVGTSGELIIEDDSILQNNDVSYSSSGKGGAVYIYGGTLTMNSGRIQNCSATSGGGVYCFRSSSNANKINLSFNGGEIIDNNCYRSNSSGGGVYIDAFATMKMTGGAINGNSAPYGGGISLGGFSFTVANNDENKDNDTEHLIITGGTIKGNTAGQNGGGIFIQSTYNATISAGNIIDNEGGGGHFGGGGIYVNGGKQGYQNGRLQLYNVLIANNTAGREGGGIAGCNTSDTRQYIIDGGIIYQNTAADQKDDILISNSDGVSHLPGFATESYISEFMLGGETYMWKRVGTDNYIGVNYLHEAGVKSVYTDLTDDDDSVKKAEESARVFITGNSATLRGGGIGSNGDVFIGGRLNDVINISVTKEWVDDNNAENTRPDSIRVWLLRNGEKVSCLEYMPDGLGTWPETLTFTDQPRVDENGEKYNYTIEEDVDGFQGIYTSEVKQDNENAWTVTNTLIQLKISKTVSGSGADENKSFPFTVTLDKNDINGKYGDVTFEDGKAQFMLKAGESANIAGLPDGTKYTVNETDADGYTVTVNGQNAPIPIAEGTIETGKTAAAAFNNYKAVVTPSGKISVAVNKVWEDNDSAQRPDSVSVQLYKNGAEYGDPVTLNKENSWKYMWTGLDESAGWTVDEVGALEGYTKNVTHKGNIWTITNTLNTAPETETGSIEISKTISGAGASAEEEFQFVITLDDASISGPYGDLDFTGGKADFTLKAGESVSVTGLPAGTKYIVTEKAGSGYTVTVNGTEQTTAEGAIEAGKTAAAAFNNHKDASAPSGTAPTDGSSTDPTESTDSTGPDDLTGPTDSTGPADPTGLDDSGDPSASDQSDTPDGNASQTGDGFHSSLWSILAAAALAGMGMLLLGYRKNPCKRKESRK